MMCIHAIRRPRDGILQVQYLGSTYFLEAGQCLHSETTSFVPGTFIPRHGFPQNIHITFSGKRTNIFPRHLFNYRQIAEVVAPRCLGGFTRVSLKTR
jgi:hypothetical protein